LEKSKSNLPILKYSGELEGQGPSSAEEEAKADDERKGLRAPALRLVVPDQSGAKSSRE
jgi:hypothetical protein